MKHVDENRLEIRNRDRRVVATVQTQLKPVQSTGVTLIH